MRSIGILLTLSLATPQLGCLGQLVPDFPSSAPAQVHAPILPHDVFETLNPPTDAHHELCANDGMHPNFPNDADQITKAFCQDLVPGGKMPTPTSLPELLDLLGIAFKDPNAGNGTGGNPAFALLGHSSALTARNVTSLTPTAFVFTPPPADGGKPSGYVFLAFDPGEQVVEVASHDPTLDVVNFYLVRFDKACNTQPGGCTAADLLTQKLVTGWSNLREYESSTALNNTIADCRQCHAPDDSQPQILRMQEIEAPFTHWFSLQTEGGRELYNDFHSAHGSDEDYGPIPAALVDKSDPALMARMIQLAGFGTQPNAFPSAAVEQQVKSFAPGQPAMNATRGWSKTWDDVYERAVTGEFIATPYHDVKVTDPAKLAKAADAWRQFRAGLLAEPPDMRDTFLDTGLRDMGFAPKLGAVPRSRRSNA